MPVDRTHAFASGPVYARPGLLGKFRHPRVAAAWRSFERGATMGNRCLLGPNAWCANEGDPSAVTLGAGVVCRGILRRESFGNGEISIGDDVYIGDDCIVSCSDSVSIGRGTLLGHSVQLFDNNSHPIRRDERAADWRAVTGGGERQPIEASPIMIGEDAWIGFGAVVLKGVTIGSGAVVGAASVVTRNVAPGVSVAGNPAQPI